MSVITITILSVRAIEKMNLVILRNQPGTSARNKKIKWGERGRGGGLAWLSDPSSPQLSAGGKGLSESYPNCL